MNCTPKLKIKLFWGCFHDKWNLWGQFSNFLPSIHTSQRHQRCPILKVLFAQRTPSISSFRSPCCNMIALPHFKEADICWYRHSKDVGFSETADLSRNTVLTAKTQWGHVLLWGIFTTRNAACGRWSCPKSIFQGINKPSVLVVFSSVFCKFSSHADVLSMH